MSGENNDLVDTISYRTNVKLPIGLITGGLVAFAVFGFSQWQAHLQYDEQRFQAARDYTDKKTASRYTGNEAAKHEKQIEQRLQDIKEKNAAEHRSLQRQLDLIEKKCEKNP